MRKRITLWSQDEYHFIGAGKFIPFLMADIHEDTDIHPAMIVIPGGGFILPSSGEADGVANKFYEMGYNTFVLVYTNNVTLDKPMINQALPDALRAVRLIRTEHKKLHIDPNKLTAIGFSGGGHLAASMATLYDHPKYKNDAKYPNVSNKLNAAVLTYALVTDGEYSCPGAYDRLVGDDGSDEERKLHSLNQQVSGTSVPMYLLHGTADVMCPPQNALLMAEACAAHNVPFEMRLLLGCNHGFAVADFAAELAWSSRYVFEQLYYTIEAMSPEEFSEYGNLFSELKQGMDYDEFAKIAQETTMLKLWMTGLHVDFERIQQAVAATTGNLSYAVQKNTNANDWWLDVDRWIKMVI